MKNTHFACTTFDHFSLDEWPLTMHLLSSLQKEKNNEKIHERVAEKKSTKVSEKTIQLDYESTDYSDYSLVDNANEKLIKTELKKIENGGERNFVVRENIKDQKKCQKKCRHYSSESPCKFGSSCKVRRLKVALSQKILENFYIAKSILQITILSRKFKFPA